MTYLRLYVDCLRRGARGALKSPWTLLLPVAYVAILFVAMMLVAPLGIVGGFILVIVANLCSSSFLYFIRQAVLGSPARFHELKQSFLDYFWPVGNFWFVVWIASLLLGYALASNPNAGKIQTGLWLVAAVLLNAVPEVIYQKSQYGGIAIIVESVKFIQTHWVEWFIPNVVLGVGAWYAGQGLLSLPFGALVFPVGMGAIAYVAMAFRGNLFDLLETNSPFQLRMRYRGGPGR